MFDIKLNKDWVLRDGKGIQLTRQEIHDACMLKPLWQFEKFFEVCMDSSTDTGVRMEELWRCMESGGDRTVIPPFVSALLFDFDGEIGFNMLRDRSEEDSDNDCLFIEEMDASMQVVDYDTLTLDARHVKYSRGGFMLKFNTRYFLSVDIYVDKDSTMQVQFFDDDNDDAIVCVRLLHNCNYSTVYSSVEFEKGIFLEAKSDDEMKWIADNYEYVAVRNDRNVRLLNFATLVNGMNRDAEYLMLNGIAKLTLRDITETLQFMAGSGKSDRLCILLLGTDGGMTVNELFMSMGDGMENVSETDDGYNYSINLVIYTQSEDLSDIQEIYSECIEAEEGAIIYRYGDMFVEFSMPGVPDFNAFGYIMNICFHGRG